MARFVFQALIATVLISPLPFGSIHPWAYTLMAVAVGLLVLAWSAGLLAADRASPATPAMIRLPALLYFAVIAWAAVQAASWTPASWHNPVWAETAALLGRPVDGSISVDPHATRTAIMRLLAYAGIFWLALQYGRSGERAKQTFQAIAIAGFGYAAYGLIVEFTGAGSILWFEKERYLDSLTSSFRYKNAYATYAGLGLIATMALLMRAIGREDYAIMGPRERARAVLSLLFERVWYLVIAFVAIVSALLLSDSRGGFVATTVALIGFALLLRVADMARPPLGRAFFGIAALVGAAYVWISGGSVFDRLAATSETDVRTLIYTHTIEGIAERPLSGWGLGTFDGVFATFQGPEFATRALRAHNEYLDNALGLGIPATVALVAALACLAVLCVRGVRRRKRNQVYPAAGAAALLLVGVQSLVDFTIQEPAVAATLALLLGTACGQSWSSLVRRTATAHD